MATDETRALARIRQAVERVARGQGMKVTDLAIIPATEEGGVTRLRGMFRIDDSIPPERTGENDEDFEKVLAEAERAELAAKADEAKEGLADLAEKLTRPGDEGIL